MIAGWRTCRVTARISNGDTIVARVLDGGAGGDRVDVAGDDLEDACAWRAQWRNARASADIEHAMRPAAAQQRMAIASRQPVVVSWWPVPRLGRSIFMAMRPGGGGATSCVP